MADQRSIEMLAFNFASKIFAYRRLAQGFCRALSAFSRFMRECLDKVIKADQCSQNVDDNGIAANDAEQLINNLRATFQCIQQAGLQLTMHKCHFGVTEIAFLGCTITPAVPNTPLTSDLLGKFTEINKDLDRCCELALKQPVLNKQIAIKTDASFSSAGYAFLIEDDPLEKNTSTRKTSAPVAYGSKTFSPSQLKISIYAKEFLAFFLAFKEFGHIF